MLRRTKLNFGAGFTGGLAHVLDLDRDFVDRSKCELIDILRVKLMSNATASLCTI